MGRIARNRVPLHHAIADRGGVARSLGLVRRRYAVREMPRAEHRGAARVGGEPQFEQMLALAGQVQDHHPVCGSEVDRYRAAQHRMAVVDHGGALQSADGLVAVGVQLDLGVAAERGEGRGGQPDLELHRGFGTVETEIVQRRVPHVVGDEANEADHETDRRAIPEDVARGALAAAEIQLERDRQSKRSGGACQCRGCETGRAVRGVRCHPEQLDDCVHDSGDPAAHRLDRRRHTRPKIRHDTVTRLEWTGTSSGVGLRCSHAGSNRPIDCHDGVRSL
ncbi:hypothetical protein RPD_2266 [Rhodopseudomonas palustris BisB5]|uniref:Uncharacterized protein n=1 Tax=Rhodopseudomonas palustris (strain BisB5) TaxID=316057 RepID=Q138I8_RHOPS|nr:hypothetical protein RPD_2266 [Rhodopseudomonas palustris BisB5]